MKTSHTIIPPPTVPGAATQGRCYIRMLTQSGVVCCSRQVSFGCLDSFTGGKQEKYDQDSVDKRHLELTVTIQACNNPDTMKVQGC